MHTSRFFLFWYTSHLNKYPGGWVLGRQRAIALAHVSALTPAFRCCV